MLQHAPDNMQGPPKRLRTSPGAEAGDDGGPLPLALDFDEEVAEGMIWAAERQERAAAGAADARLPAARPARLANLAAGGDEGGLFGGLPSARPPPPPPRLLANEVAGAVISVTSACRGHGQGAGAGRRVYCSMAGVTPAAADAAARAAEAASGAGRVRARPPAGRLLSEPIQVLLVKAEQLQLQVGALGFG